MDDWQPDDPGVLEFDLNECTPREFCEVFDMEPWLANNLQEYRSEILHIFRFEQLLKLKGISEEALQRWRDPKPTDVFDKELQSSLNMQTDSPEPLSKLLDGICKQTNASVCLIARYGKILIQSVANGSSFDSIAPEIPGFIRPLQEDMLQMNLGTAHTEVIGFDSNDLLLLPASAFYLAALQPKGNLNPASLSLWRSLAAVVRGRYPSKICINNHAPVTENDVVFNCPQCNLRIVVDRSGIGYTFPCPRCKTAVTIPGVPVSDGASSEGENTEAAPPETASA